MALSAESVAATAHDLAQRLRAAFAADWSVTVEKSEAQLGGGTDPLVRLPSTSLVLARVNVSGTALQAQLLQAPVPLIGRVRGDFVWLDVRTLIAGSHGATTEARAAELLTSLRAV